MLCCGPRDAGNVTVTVPLSEIDNMPRLLRLLEELQNSEAAVRVRLASSCAPCPLVSLVLRDCVCVCMHAQTPSLMQDTTLLREWTVSHATLEEVFLVVSQRAKFDLAEAAVEVDDSVDAEDHGAVSGSNVVDGESKVPDVSNAGALQPLTGSGGASAPLQSGQPSRWSGIRALFRKNLSLQKRQKGMCICTILTPLTVMGLLLLFQVHGKPCWLLWLWHSVHLWFHLSFRALHARSSSKQRWAC